MKLNLITAQRYIARSSVLALGSLVLGCSESPDLQSGLQSRSYLSQEHRFAEEVLLGAEYGTKTSAVRWVSSPSISSFGANPEQRAALTSAVGQINSAISNTGVQVIPTSDHDETANITVYFAPLSQIPMLARQKGVEYVSGNVGFVWNYWNGKNELTRSVIFIASDSIYSGSVEHIVLEETSQAMGLMDDSNIFSDSVFFSSLADSGDTTHLSSQDRKLMRFFYSHLNPKDGAQELKEAFLRFWSSTSGS